MCNILVRRVTAQYTTAHSVRVRWRGVETCVNFANKRNVITENINLERSECHFNKQGIYLFESPVEFGRSVD